MDSSHVGLARRYCDLLHAGEYHAVPKLLHEECVVIPIRSSDWTPNGTNYKGHDGWQSLMEHMGVQERGYDNEVTVRPVGDGALATGVLKREEDDGSWSAHDVAVTFAFSDGLISRIEGFWREDEAVESLQGGGNGLLTPRQREILGLLAEGLNGPEVARRLSISPGTVRTHVTNAMGALEVKTRAQLVAEAARRGEISL